LYTSLDKGFQATRHEMGGECSTRLERKEISTKFSLGKLKRRDLFEERGLAGTIIRILVKFNVDRIHLARDK
jgi:hypothetical protein